MATKSKSETKKSENKKEGKFPKGIIVFSPNEKAPDFVKAEIIIGVEEFKEFLDETSDTVENEKYGEQLKLTLKESKEGKLYLQINDFQKSK